MNNTQLQKHKAQLLALKAEYETRINDKLSQLENPKDELAEHWSDQGAATQQDNMRKNLIAEAEIMLEKVNNALLRIENGNYGQCSCGEEVEETRLDAVPYATKCMQHAK